MPQILVPHSAPPCACAFARSVNRTKTFHVKHFGPVCPSFRTKLMAKRSASPNLTPRFAAAFARYGENSIRHPCRRGRFPRGRRSGRNCAARPAPRKKCFPRCWPVQPTFRRASVIRLAKCKARHGLRGRASSAHSDGCGSAKQRGDLRRARLAWRRADDRLQ